MRIGYVYIKNNIKKIFFFYHNLIDLWVQINNFQLINITHVKRWKY